MQATIDSLTTEQRISPWKLLGRVSVSLLVILFTSIVLGVLLLFPAAIQHLNDTSATSTTHQVVRVYVKTVARPSDDRALTRWIQTLSGAENVQVTRGKTDLLIRFDYYRDGFFLMPKNRLCQLGYRYAGSPEVNQYIAWSKADRRRAGQKTPLYPLSAPQFLIAMLCTSVLFLVSGLWYRRREKENGRSLPSLWSGSVGRAILWGLAGGIVLRGIALIYLLLFHRILHILPPSPWMAAAGFGIGAKVVLLFLGAVVAPVVEEIYFRGYMFALFRREGYVRFGLVASALLFTAAHFPVPLEMGAIFLMGLVLGGLYYRTNSLLVPIIAHGINNGLAFALLFFVHGR